MSEAPERICVSVSGLDDHAVDGVANRDMNRYRTIPGTGPPKASATTTCQKCLQKDEFIMSSLPFEANAHVRHYSYECKANLQERPYASRPSRTQQFRNPKLAPRLTSENPNTLLNKYVSDLLITVLVT